MIASKSLRNLIFYTPWKFAQTLNVWYIYLHLPYFFFSGTNLLLNFQDWLTTLWFCGFWSSLAPHLIGKYHSCLATIIAPPGYHMVLLNCLKNPGHQEHDAKDGKWPLDAARPCLTGKSNFSSIFFGAPKSGSPEPPMAEHAWGEILPHLNGRT